MNVCDRCGSVLDRLPACPRCLLGADIGARVVGEHYELEEGVGHGGMGTVYRARDVRDDSIVAVKLLREELTEQPGFLERFRQESRALAIVRHPGIVRLRDWGVDEASAFIVMEYVDGRSLAGQLPLSPRRARQVAREVCEALAAAHRLGLVHRDLKPENILVDARGTVKISDFGIAAFAHERGSAPRLTAAHQIVGTPAYMAPEALRGAPPDPRMDVYSLGVLFYELVEGHPPQGYFEPPAPFTKVLKRALAADPAQRYANAGEMLDDLEPPAAPAVVADLPPLDRAAAPVVATILGASLAALIAGALSRLAGPSLGSDAGLDGLGAAAVALIGGAVCAQRLLSRWRRLVALPERAPAHLPQSTPMLRFTVLALILAIVHAVRVVPPAADPWLGLVVRAAQVAGLATGIRGELEARRLGGHADEPWLWLGLGLVVVSFVVAAAR